MTKNEIRVLLFVARQTYGYHRETARISRNDFNDALKISFRHITEIQERLQEVGLLVLVNKGNSKLNSSEWKLDFSNPDDKLEKLSKIDRRSPDWKLTTSNPKVTSDPWVSGYPKVNQLGTLPGTPLEPVNKELNKDAIQEILSLKKGKAHVTGGTLFVNGKKINNPSAYLNVMKKNDNTSNLQTQKGGNLDAKDFKYPR